MEASVGAPQSPHTSPMAPISPTLKSCSLTPQIDGEGGKPSVRTTSRVGALMDPPIEERGLVYRPLTR